MSFFVQRTYYIDCFGDLKDAINANVTITTELLQIVYDGTSESFFEFIAEPLAPEIVELDSILATYTCPVDTTQPVDTQNFDDTAPAEENTIWSSEKITYELQNLSLGELLDVTDSNLTIGDPDSTSTIADQLYVLKGKAGADGYDVTTFTDGGGDASVPTGLTEWHDVQEYGDQHNVGNKFLDVTTSSTPSNESSIIMLQGGEIEHVTISTSRNPADVGTVKIFKDATRGGAGAYAGGTQVGADLDKSAGDVNKVYTNLTGYTFAAGDKISVYLESNPDNLYQPVVKLFIRYD